MGNVLTMTFLPRFSRIGDCSVTVAPDSDDVSAGIAFWLAVANNHAVPRRRRSDQFFGNGVADFSRLRFDEDPYFVILVVGHG
jgi:hypothetical protein